MLFWKITFAVCGFSSHSVMCPLQSVLAVCVFDQPQVPFQAAIATLQFGCGDTFTLVLLHSVAKLSLAVTKTLRCIQQTELNCLADDYYSNRLLHLRHPHIYRICKPYLRWKLGVILRPCLSHSSQLFLECFHLLSREGLSVKSTEKTRKEKQRNFFTFWFLR